jgi:Domain of unknown function (DUF6894)
MPRYFFHISDGKLTFTDSTGVEFAGAAAARAHTTRQIRDIKGALSERHIMDWSGWKLIVANTEGKTVFEAGFDLDRAK